MEQILERFWSKFFSDFETSSAILEEVFQRFWRKFFDDFARSIAAIFEQLVSDNPSRVVVVTARKKSEVRVTRSGNVATVCAIDSKNGTAVERAYYERSTDRAGPFFHRLNLNGAP